MIALRGRSRSTSVVEPLRRTVYRISDSPTSLHDRSRSAYLVGGDLVRPPGFGAYLNRSGTPANEPETVELPAELDYLSDGDVISLAHDGSRVAVLYRKNGRQNSVLLTERCDNYCLMCSQPPRERDDSWLIDQAMEMLTMLPPDCGEIGFTGGEPTLYGDRFIELMQLCADHLSETDIHILSNGRRFADLGFAAKYAAIDNPRMMVGIPLYGSESSLHDYVVQAHGAFDETVKGILNLGRLDQRIEIRVVIHQQTAPALVEIADFIARNLPFVEQVALMGLEMMGLARRNINEVWIDPHDYRAELTEAATILDRHGVRTMIYNHQLCLLDRAAWRFAVKSISDWKNEYLPECSTCTVREQCGGFFSSAKYRVSQRIHPITSDQSPQIELRRGAGPAVPVAIRSR
jgi:His-Xaa-Ser system radical SAM maturase HxsC